MDTTTFTQGWVNGWIIFFTALMLISSTWLLIWTKKFKNKDEGKGEELDHSFDGIVELNTPLPRWWLYCFYIGIIWAVVYLVLYPGLGDYKGTLGWTSKKQYDEESEKVNLQINRIFKEYTEGGLEQMLADEDVLDVGRRLYVQNCSTCHAADAKGSRGYPNLTDTDWLYGGQYEQIITTLTNGRNGNMPAMAAAVGDEKAQKDLAAYILSLSGNESRSTGDPEAGKAKYIVCMGCHNSDGSGNIALGAPNLSDDIWLYGGREADILYAIQNGRQNQMPAFKHKFNDNQIKVIAAYVYSLSQEKTKD